MFVDDDSGVLSVVSAVSEICVVISSNSTAGVLALIMGAASFTLDEAVVGGATAAAAAESVGLDGLVGLVGLTGGT